MTQWKIKPGYTSLGPAPASSTAASSGGSAAFVLLAKGFMFLGLTTFFWLSAAKPTGDLTIKSYFATTGLTPSPPPEPPSSPDKPKKYSASSPFYHNWGGATGQGQKAYLGSFPDGVTVFSPGGPDEDIFNVGGTLSPFAFTYGNSSRWAQDYYITDEFVYESSLMKGFRGHTFAQMGLSVEISPLGPPQMHRVFSYFFDRRFPRAQGTVGGVTGRGRPELVVLVEFVVDGYTNQQLEYYGNIFLELKAKEDGIDVKSLKEKIRVEAKNRRFDAGKVGVYHVEFYEIEYEPKVKTKTKNKMPCCSIAQCKYISGRVNTAVKKLEKLIKDYTEYSKHDFSGYFEPYCAEEGTKNPVTGEPLDWSDPATKKLVETTPELFEEAYGGPGLKGLARMLEAIAFRESTILGTERSRNLFCEVEEPEIVEEVIGSGITDIKPIALPKDILYVTIEIEKFETQALRRFYHEDLWLSSAFPKRAWFGFVSFVDDKGRASSDMRVDYSKINFSLPFPSKWIVLRLEPFVQARVVVTKFNTKKS